MVVGSSSLPVLVAQSDQKRAPRARVLMHKIDDKLVPPPIYEISFLFIGFLFLGFRFCSLGFCFLGFVFVHWVH